MSLSSNWFAGVGSPSYLDIRRDADFSGAGLHTSTPGDGYIYSSWYPCNWLVFMPNQRGGADNYNRKDPEYGYVYGKKDSDSTEVGFHFVYFNTLTAPAADSEQVNMVRPFADPYGINGAELKVAVPTGGSNTCSVWLYQPFSWYGRVGQVIASMLRYAGVPTSAIDADAFSDADDEQAGMGSDDSDEPWVFYRRSVGQSLADSIKAIARCSWNVLTINASGEIALIPRTTNATDYTLAGLTLDDGVISVQWQYRYDLLINDVLTSHGRFLSYHSDLPTSLSASEVSVPPKISGREYFPYAQFTDATSKTKYGTRTGGAPQIRVTGEDNIDQTVRAFHFQYLTNVEEAGESADAMTTLMGRMDIEAALRKEITIVQDMRGLDYDVGWTITNVAVTSDGVTIGKMHCIKKVVDFDDRTVTSTLLEEPS